MRYYEILKQRRLDLKLSIQDVSAQTRLAPEYIQAIEDNNLDVFSDDLSFVRYFIRAYCQAIGVNWEVLQPEVEGTIKYYAHMRNMALTQAQKRMVQSMPQAESKTAAKPRRSRRQSRVNKAGKSLAAKTPKRRISGKALALIIAAGVVLFGANFALNWFEDQQTAAAAALKAQEQLDKEAETERLAQLRKEGLGLVETPEEAQPEVPAETVTQSGNIITVRADLPVKVVFQASFPETSTVLLSNGEDVFNDMDTAYDQFDQTVTMDTAGTLYLTCYNAADMSLSINGTAIDCQPGEDGSLTITVYVTARESAETAEATDEPAE